MRWIVEWMREEKVECRSETESEEMIESGSEMENGETGDKAGSEEKGMGIKERETRVEVENGEEMTKDKGVSTRRWRQRWQKR